jgi:hypothetical protein
MATPAPAATAAARRPWTAIPAALLVAVALWEIVATRCQATDVVGDDEWAAAARVVRAGYQRGDLIVFAPRWADPIGRLHLGDLIPVEVAGRMDDARFARVWELSIRGAHAPEVAQLAPIETHEGRVDVRLYQRPAPTVVAELARQPADRPLRVDLFEVAFEPHRCILVPTFAIRPYLDALLANLDRLPPGKPREQLLRTFDAMLPELGQARSRPPAERTGTRIVFRDMPLGRELVGYLGIADVFTRREDRAPVTLDVEVGAGKTQVTAPIDRWVRWSVPTTAGRGDVAVTIKWEARPGEVWGAKQVCFAAEARQ